MFNLEASHEFNAPSAAVWEYLQDFGHIERWWPRNAQTIKIERIELEGSGVGMLRHIYNAGMPMAITERLDALDAVQKTIKISIVGDRPGGLTWYEAFGKLVDLPGGRCRLDYRGEFTTQSNLPDDARGFLGEAYRLMFVGLSEALARDA
jgi:hypothetical protein